MANLEEAFRDAADEVAQIKAQPSNRYWWLYGTVEARNENGTLDVAIDGVTIQQVKATISCMMANVGDRVVVLKAGPIMTCVDVISGSVTGTAYSTRDWLRLSSTPVTLERGGGHKIGPKVFLIGHSEFPTNSNGSSGYVRIWATWGGLPGIDKSAADVTFTMRNDLHAFVNQFSGSVGTAGTNSLAVREDSSGILWFYLYTDFEYYTAEVRAAGEQFVVDAKWQDSEPSGNLVWSSDNPTAYTAHGNQLYSGMSIGTGLKASGRTLSVDDADYIKLAAGAFADDNGKNGVYLFRWGPLRVIQVQYTHIAKGGTEFGHLPDGEVPRGGMNALGYLYVRGVAGSCGQVNVNYRGEVSAWMDRDSDYCSGQVVFFV